MNLRAHRPCFILFIFFAAGIVVGRMLMWPFWLLVLPGFLLIGLYFWNKSALWLFVLVFLLGGLSVTHRSLLPQYSLAFLPFNKAMQVNAIEGIIISPQEGVVQVEGIRLKNAWEKVSGAIKLRVPVPSLPCGMRLQIKGRLQPVYEMPKSNFSYRRYLHERGIYWIFRQTEAAVDVLAIHQGNWFIEKSSQARMVIDKALAGHLSPQESAFMSALLIGERHQMSKELKEIFTKSGTAHILAISGLNMTVITSVLFFLFQLTTFSRRWKFFLTAIFLLVYALISGWSPSVVRASLMSAALLISFATEYEGEPLNSLGLAGLILLLLNPFDLYDIGFQLSFAAVFGILIISPLIEDRLKFMPKILVLSVAVSTAAFITTLPITLYHFQTITPIAIVSNIFVVPMADFLMILGLGLVGLSFFAPLALLFASCIKAILSAMIILATWFANIPGGNWQF